MSMSDIQIDPQDIVNALVQQRDAALSDAVQVRALNAALQRRVAALETEVSVFRDAIENPPEPVSNVCRCEQPCNCRQP